MRLKSIEVSGFRGLASKQWFDLSANAIIVVGSNGLGKTSLLDAIHWGISGRLGRIPGGDQAVVSMYSGTGQARVSLTLSNGNRDFTISRVTDGDFQFVQATIGDNDFKGTSAQARICEALWPEAVSAKDGEEALSAALSQSVYLQQDRLRAFLEAETAENRFDVINELVGAQRLTELLAQLESQSRSWSIATTKLEKESTPLDDRVTELKSVLQRLRQSATSLIEVQEPRWNAWWESCRSLGVSVTSVPTPTSADASSTLDLALRETRALLDRNRRTRSLTETAIKTFANPPPKPSSTITELKERVTAARRLAEEARAAMKAGQERVLAIRAQQVASREEKEQRQALAQLAIRLLDERCPVCQQIYDIGETQKRLQGIIDSISLTENLPEINEDTSELAAREADAYSSEHLATLALADGLRLQEQYDRWKRECDQSVADLGLRVHDNLTAALESRLKEIDGIELTLTTHIADGEALAFSMARETARARVASVERDLATAQSELSLYQQVLLKRKLTSKAAHRLIDSLRDARSQIAISKLVDIEPLLQRIFSRIDPHPTFRVVKLVTEIIRGKGRLDAEIHDTVDGKTSKSPAAVFSSSQLNALAVSIFLSFNLAIPNLPLHTAILDDPMQSLDDINLLGLVDLLRRMKDRRQIIVSTHDARFGRLLARKLRPANAGESTSVIDLRGWKRSGPDVYQYPIEADVAPLRLVGAM